MTTKTLSLRLPLGLYEQLEREAMERKISVAQVITGRMVTYPIELQEIEQVPDEPGLLETHRILTEAHALLATLYPVKAPISADSAFAIGETLGILTRAKALVGRDIDDLRSGL